MRSGFCGLWIVNVSYSMYVKFGKFSLQFQFALSIRSLVRSFHYILLSVVTLAFDV